MARKQQLDKSAWQWAESTDPESITEDEVHKAYRLSVKPCKPEKCRRNCKGNPHCLVGLGEKGWFVEIDDKYWYDIDDPSAERRQEGELAGLRNLGATCYLNTLLQLWFHNLTLRSAILKLEEPLSTPVDNIHDDIDKMKLDKQADVAMPTTACGHLQLIFALLQYSKRRYIDPTPFINCLGLDAAQQQDAQEFSKLFMSLLEDSLQQQPDPDIRNLVQRQFTGVYSYVTTCSACGNGSQHNATFYELDLNIKGHKHLTECIDEFIQEEQLEGDNQYMCTACNRKQNAVRRIQLQSLPPVLNVQLLRFVFDRASGVKKKLNTYIQFPEVLDMSHYLGEKKGTTVYDLSAVLIHRGPSAYSGHYVAHIRNQETDVWYKFNDEKIEKMESDRLTLSKEDEQELFGKNDEKPKTPKGAHCSRNAYMLVYCQRRKQDQVPDVPSFDMLPSRLQKCLELDNQNFEQWTKAMEKIRDENVAKGHARQADVKDIYAILPAPTVDDMEWIPTKWLRDWLGGDGRGKVPEVDTTPLLCQHKRMDPDKVNMAKCVSSKAGDLIYAKFKGKQRLKGKASLCFDCVTERCRAIRRRACINEDSKLIGQLLRSQTSDISVDSGYWVGKLSLRSWKKLALEKMEDKQKITKDTDSLGSEATTAACPNTATESESTKAGDGTSVMNTLHEQNDKTSAEMDDDVELQFNEDLLCEKHGNLVIEENCRRLVPDHIWKRLKFYFPDAAEFPAQTEPCQKCKAEREKEEQIKASLKLIASEQRSQLSDLYYGKNRPSWNADTNMLWLVTTSFLEDWRKFVRDPAHNEEPAIINRSMLCQHDGFIYKPELITPDSSYGLEYVRFAEWQHLVNYVTFDVEVTVTKVENDDSPVTFIVQPGVCADCAAQREQAELEKKLTYTKATIYIHKLSPDDITACLDPMYGVTNMVPDPGSYSKLSSETVQALDQEQKCKAVKRKISPESQILDKVAKIESGTRRSTRHRRIRGEKDVTVSSAMTLRELKLEIMKQFCVAPFDQHLLLKGKELTGDKETLASLQILPETTLYLKVDENVEDPTFLEEVKGTEEGFKGTCLMGR